MNGLLFDVGNSALKWKLAECPTAIAERTARSGPDTVRLGAGAALPHSIDGDFAVALAAQLADLPRIDAAFGCNVAGRQVATAVEAAVRHRFGVPVTWFGSQARFDDGDISLRSGYRDPLQLGADRWHAMLAARAAWPEEALVVINAGTATTVDCVSAEGRFVGGVIAPGVQLMLHSLARQTAQLPLAEGRYVAHPDNTDDAIATGVIECQLGLIERRVLRFAGQGHVRVLVDGGHAAALLAGLQFEPRRSTVDHERDLVLRGVLLRACAATRR
jgi:type III pantothenate kinase